MCDFRYSAIAIVFGVFYETKGDSNIFSFPVQLQTLQLTKTLIRAIQITLFQILTISVKLLFEG